VKHRTVSVVLLIAASLTSVSAARGRKQLWSIDLLKLSGLTGNSESEYVWGLAFSPDETKLAIGFNDQGQAAASRVIIVSVDHPNSVFRRFDSDRLRGAELYVRENIQWSPSGDFLAAYGRVSSVQGDRAYRIPEDSTFGGFLGNDRFVIAKRELRGVGGMESVNKIEVRRQDFTVEDSWNIAQGLFNVRDTCPHAGTIAIQGMAAGRPDAKMYTTQLVRYPGQVEGQLWTSGIAPLGGLILADSCKLICSSYGVPSGKEPAHAACWSTESGARIAEDAKLTTTTQEAFAGSGGALIAVTVSHWACLNGKFWQFFDIDGCATPETHRVLWNIETGQEALSWPVLKQPFRILNRETSGPFALALSSTGRYLAEGGAGHVQLYAVR
jgi:hypothetical protein